MLSVRGTDSLQPVFPVFAAKAAHAPGGTMLMITAIERIIMKILCFMLVGISDSVSIQRLLCRITIKNAIRFPVS
jgi:hypothetical protein